eukprot:jgi/Chrpa1/18590/Chrysochromulina_OHIO_Genome00023884-RA
MVRYYYDGTESSSSLGDGEQPMLAEILLSRLPTPVVRVDWKVLQMAVRRPQAAPSGSVEASIMRRYQLRHCERMREALGRLWNTASLGEEVMSKGDFVAWHALLSRALLARTDERTGLIVADCEWALYCLDSLEDGMPQGPFEEWCFEVLESWAPTTYAGAKASSEAEISAAMSDLVDELIEALTVRGAKHELRPLDEVEWLGLSRPESYIHGLPTLLNWPQCRFLVAAALAWRGPTEPSKAQLIEIARGRMQSPPPPTGASAPPSTHALQSRLAQPQAGLGSSSMLDTALGRSVAPLDELRPYALDVAPLPRLDGMVARRAQQRSGQRSAAAAAQAAVRTARAVLGPDAIKRLEARARGAIMAAVGPLVPGVPLNTPNTALHTLSTPATADACDDAGGPAEPLEVFGSVDATLLDELAGIGRSELESPGWSTSTSQLRNELATWITLSRGRVSYLNREKSKTSQVTASSAKAALKEGVRTPLELSRNEIRTRLERQHGPFELLALRTALEVGETVTGS